jgi:hypothetical protein
VAREQDLDRGAGTLAQVGTDLLLRVAGSAAAADAGSYRVFLDPARKCQSMRWLYPGDRLQVEVTPLRAATLLGPVDRVELGGVTFPSNGEVSTAALGRLEISAGSSTLLDATFDLRDLAAAPPSWTLDPPIAPGMPLTLAVSTAATAPFTLLTSIEISADGLPPGGGAR